MKRPALLVIDMLNDFLERWEADDRAALSRGINGMTGAFRANQRPVIWVRQEFEPDLSDAYPWTRCLFAIHQLSAENCQTIALSARTTNTPRAYQEAMA